MRVAREEALERILRGFIAVPESGCWLWERAINNYGYGALRVRGTTYTAHRVSWFAHFGEVPAGAHVCHKCDTRSCVNPAHLFLGTNADNMADKIRKGRQPRGEDSPSAVLTKAQVDEIRAATGVTQRSLAARYGVSQSQIYKIRKWQRWVA